MPDPGQQVRARTAVDGRGPADDVRAPAEQREDLPVPVGPSAGLTAMRAHRYRRPAASQAGNDDAVACTSVRRIDMMASREFMARRHKPRAAARGGVDDGHAG